MRCQPLWFFGAKADQITVSAPERRVDWHGSTYQGSEERSRGGWPGFVTCPALAKAGQVAQVRRGAQANLATAAEFSLD